MPTEQYELTSEREARAAFWREHPKMAHRRRSWLRQNQYLADIRTAWCDWVDAAQRDGRMSDRLADRVTL